MPRDRERDRKDEREKDRKDDSDDSDADSDYSDPDYKSLSDADLDEITQQGISQEKAFDLWNKQSGLCYITNLPLTFGGRGNYYKCEVAPRRISETVDDSNCILVCSGVSAMREATQMTWSQFKAFVYHVSQSMD